MEKRLEKKKYWIIGALVFLGVFHAVVLYHLLNYEGRFLYSYVFPFYGVYYLFNMGIVYCVKKIIIEYQTLGYYKAKSQFLRLSCLFSFLLSFLLAILFYFLSPIFIPMLVGNYLGLSLLKDIILISKMTGIIVFLFPLLNLYRGYFIGHRLEINVFCSYLLEIVGGIVFSLLGAFFYMKSSSKNMILFILWTYFFSTLISFVYLIFIRYRKKIKFEEKIRKIREPVFSHKLLLQKLVSSLSPYFFLLLLAFLYVFVDIWYFSRTLELEKWISFYANFSVWAMIFSAFLIIISLFVFYRLTIGMGRKKTDIFVYRVLIFLISFLMPFTFLLSFLGKPIWFLLYDNSIYGYSMLSYSIFLGFFFSIYLVVILVLKQLHIYKSIQISMLIHFVFKLILTYPFINVFHQLGFSAYYGIITAGILSYFIAFIYCLLVLHFKYKISFEIVIKSVVDVICGSIVMMVALNLLRLLVPIYFSNRIIDLLFITFSTSIGWFTYLVSIRFLKFKEKLFFLNAD